VVRRKALRHNEIPYGPVAFCKRFGLCFTVAAGDASKINEALQRI
jgi:hypothetical protein